ncbi:MAG: phospho-N-acetylmuramoyl-pentapeptide-transferase [Saprospiraceae bacterium]|nr:phospho-N-acetylmuramoyl-pentapeptide-transferase [Saprospiraceae bacterium]
MLYYLFDFIEKNYNLPGAGLFQFISFRSGAAIIISLMISILLGKRIISSLKKRQVGESVRDLGLHGQKEKEGTPTMGGLIIVLSIMVPCLLFARLDNVYVQVMIFATLWMALIGFIDDYIKVYKKDKKGLQGKFKILGQVVLGLVVALTMLYHPEVVVQMSEDEAGRGNFVVVDRPEGQVDGENYVYVKSSLTNVPFVKGNNLKYSDLLTFLGNGEKWTWILFIPLVVFIVTAVSNAANLTDGLDGLATGVSAIIAITLAALAYVSGNTIIADYLNIFYIPFSGELVIYSACFLGACIGFLWYNAYPARVFMGDTGSLAIGGIIASMAVLIRKELLIPILCGVFVIENLSVVMQVAYFKYTKRKYGEGRRIWLMSPLHHHYQLKGMHEAKIVTRLWIIGVLLAVLTVITLKIR